MSFRAVRGMRDLFGNEVEQWKAVEQWLQKAAESFGYGEIRTPALEHLEVFTKAVGEGTDIVEKQMYVLTTESGEKLALRPEGTAAFVRAVAQSQLHRSGHPGRYYYLLPMYRHERPQKGRLREFFQFGAELINDSSPEADAEIILFLDYLYRSMSFTEFEVRLNSVGDSESRERYRQVLQEFFRPKLEKLCESCQSRFERATMRILDCKRESCQELAQGAPLIVDSLSEKAREHHVKVKSCLDVCGLKYIDDPTIVRGLDYYCFTAFEFTTNLLGAQSALAGGGRYDIAERFGEKSIPAIGFAMGMERLMMALEAVDELPKVERSPLAFFVALGDAAFEKLYPLSLDLKRQGVYVEMLYDRAKSLKAQLKGANRLGASFAVILGEDELNSSQVIVKNMEEGTQQTIPMDSVIELLSRRAKGE